MKLIAREEAIRKALAASGVSASSAVDIDELGHQQVVELALVKHGQTYLFRFRLWQRQSVLKQIGQMAADPKSDFSWYDAAILSQRVRNVCDTLESQMLDGDGGCDCHN